MKSYSMSVLNNSSRQSKGNEENLECSSMYVGVRSRRLAISPVSSARECLVCRNWGQERGEHCLKKEQPSELIFVVDRIQLNARVLCFSAVPFELQGGSNPTSESLATELKTPGDLSLYASSAHMVHWQTSASPSCSEQQTVRSWSPPAECIGAIVSHGHSIV